MSDDKKTCPFCGKEILAIAKKCRYCGKWLNEDKNDTWVQENIGIEKTIACPFCGEKILATAKKCKHCNEWLEEPSQINKETKNKWSGFNTASISLFGVMFLLFLGELSTYKQESPQDINDLLGGTLIFLAIPALVVSITGMGKTDNKALNLGCLVTSIVCFITFTVAYICTVP